MFKPVLTVLGMFILGLPTGADAAYTSGSIKPVYSSCSGAGYRDSAGNYCGYSTPTIYTGTSGGACGSTKTCYSGGNTAYASCSAAGYRDSYGNYCGATKSTFYKPAASCSSTITCYKGGSPVCSSSSYPYSSISNATMSGACAGYRSTAGSSCSGSSATYYSGFTCNSGYCKSGSACTKSYASCSAYSSTYAYAKSSSKCGQSSITIKGNPGGSCTTLTCYTAGTACSNSCPSGTTSTTLPSGKCWTSFASNIYCSTCALRGCYAVANVCSSTTYPYGSIANATMSGACTGYRGGADGACTGSSSTYYSSFTCNSGYTKSGSSCIKKLSTGCSTCCTTAKPYCYNNTCYTTCPLTNGTQCLMCAASQL